MNHPALKLTGIAVAASLLTTLGATAQDSVLYVVEPVELGEALGTVDVYIPIYIDSGLARLPDRYVGEEAWLDPHGDADAVPVDTSGDSSEGATVSNYVTPYDAVSLK